MTPGSSGSLHSVIDLSRVWQLYIAYYFVFCELHFFDTDHGNIPFHLQGFFSGVLLGDRGYACQPYLMTPYPDPDAGPQTTFNVALSKTRVRIEMTLV